MKKKRSSGYSMNFGSDRPGAKGIGYAKLRPKAAKRRLSATSPPLPPLPAPLPINVHYTVEQEDALIARARLGDRVAGDMLLMAFDNTLKRCAKKWFYSIKGHDLEIDDLIQAARMGLMHAVHKFDRSKGGFEAYLSEWTMQHCVRSIQNFGYTVRVPVHKHQALSNHERHQPDEDLSPQLQEVVMAKRPARLDEPLKGVPQMTRGDLLCSAAEGAEEARGADELRRVVREAAAQLRLGMTPLDRAILDQRILAEEPRCMAAIGHDNQRSRERTRQRETVVMTQLRLLLRKRLTRADVV